MLCPLFPGVLNSSGLLYSDIKAKPYLLLCVWLDMFIWSGRGFWYTMTLVQCMALELWFSTGVPRKLKKSSSLSCLISSAIFAVITRIISIFIFSLIVTPRTLGSHVPSWRARYHWHWNSENMINEFTVASVKKGWESVL